MARKRIDVVSNGTASQYDIVMEESLEEVGAFSPVRALQVGGNSVSEANPLPIQGNTVVENLPNLDDGRLPVKAFPSALFYSNYAAITRVGSVVVKNSPGVLCSLDSDGTSLLDPIYLQLFDATAIPSGGARCKRFFPVLPGSLLVYGVTELEMIFNTGIVVTVSSTRDTYTAISDLTNIFFTITYR